MSWLALQDAWMHEYVTLRSSGSHGEYAQQFMTRCHELLADGYASIDFVLMVAHASASPRERQRWESLDALLAAKARH